MTGLLLFVFVGFAAFAVDVGNWYLIGQQEQRAADAAAMAGVTSLPGDATAAFSTAQRYSKINGFEDGVKVTTVTPAVDTASTRLRVTVSRTVKNFFGSLLGVPTTAISRSSVADYAGPIPMGSPCNAFGNDPDPGSNRGTACAGVLGQMWGNVNSPGSAKSNGDAYQSNTCTGSVDGCTGSTNTDYSTDGYFYTISVKAAMPSLTIQLFDPVFVDTGLTCNTNFGSGATAATAALNDVVTDESTRYASGASGAYCTGDNMYSGSQVMNTEFTVRDPGANGWDPTSFQPHLGCRKTYPGWAASSASGTNLFHILDKADPKYNAPIVDGFRRWTTLCTIANPVVGDYLVQVKTNVGGSFDSADAGNRFSIRAYGMSSANNNQLSIAGRETMGMFSNKPGATTEFHLARVLSGSAGQTLNVRLFDVGDSSQNGTIRIVYPPDAAGGPFTGCQGTGPASGPLINCSFDVLWLGTVSDHQGKWQSVSVPIPPGYRCTDSDSTKCWVRLQYVYGSGSAPTDVTSWTASLQGDPVRLVE